MNISSKFEWNPHIKTKVAKANKTLGFAKRNLKNAPKAVKKDCLQSPCDTPIGIHATVWDPWTAELIKKSKMVQRRAAQFVLKRYHQPSSMGSMLTQLGWETLQERRGRMRVLLLYKATHQLVAVKSILYPIPITAPTHQDHIHTYLRITTKSNYHKYLFYPCTIKEWNKLPPSIIKSPDFKLFKVELAGYSSPVALM